MTVVAIQLGFGSLEILLGFKKKKKRGGYLKDFGCTRVKEVFFAPYTTYKNTRRYKTKASLLQCLFAAKVTVCFNEFTVLQMRHMADLA